MILHPFSRTWWIEENLILGGCYPGDLDPKEATKKLTSLVDFGIRTIICLQEPNETGTNGKPFDPYMEELCEIAKKKGVEITRKCFPIPDGSAPSAEKMQEILQCIRISLEKDKPVYVHCWGGHGRTGTIAGCWLVERGIEANQALTHIKNARRHSSHLKSFLSPHTTEQINMVKNWKMN